MKLEFISKSLDYNLDGSLKGTIVTLGHMDGGHLPVVLAEIEVGGKNGIKKNTI